MTIISIWKRMHARIACLGCPHAQEIRSLRTSIDTVRKKVYRDGLRGEETSPGDHPVDGGSDAVETPTDTVPAPLSPDPSPLTGEALALSQCANTLRSISNGR